MRTSQTDIARLSIPGTEVSATSLQIVDVGFSYEAFEDLVRMAGTFGDAARWWLGDLLLFGEARYGERYAQALEFARVGEHTLSRYRLVCERIARGRRRPNLSFSHHVEVAPLDPTDQDILLARAEDQGWSVARTREACRDLRALAARKPVARQEVVGDGFAPIDAIAGLAAAEDAFALTYRHLRDPGSVDTLAVAEAIPAALRGIQEAGDTVRAATARLASPSLREAGERLVRQATRSSGFAMVPDEVFEAFAEVLRQEAQ